MANKPSAMDLLYLGNAPKPKPVYTTPIVDSLSRPAPRKPVVKPKPTVRDVLASAASTLSPTNVANALYETGKDVIEATPEALARAYGYVTTTPVRQMAGDVGNAAQAFGRYFVENPVEAAMAAMDFIPGVGEAKQLGQDIRAAAQRRAIGDLSGAQRLEGLALPLAAATLIPGLGEGRAAARAADGASGVLRLNELTRQYEMDLPDLTPPATTPDFSGYQFTRSSTAAPQAPQQLPLDFNKPAPPQPSLLPAISYAKPAGNLNLTPRLAPDVLKGPEKQSVSSFINQYRNQPGVTKEGLDRLLAVFPDQNEVITKADFAARAPASQYNKVDLTANVVGGYDEDAAFEYATEMANDDYAGHFSTIVNMSNGNLSPGDERVLLNLYDGRIGWDQLDGDTRQRLSGAGINNTSDLEDAVFDANHELVNEYLQQIEAGDLPSHVQGGPKYFDFQRLLVDPNANREGYFELGVVHPEHKGSSQHFNYMGGNGNPEGGLVGHVRGTFAAEPTELLTDTLSRQAAHPGESIDFPMIQTKPNSMIIEEIQSDAQGRGGSGTRSSDTQTGPLHQIHGTLFKSAVQHALENGATTVYLPTAKPIAAVRFGAPDKYKAIYDEQVIKEGLKPLLKIPGVEGRKVGGGAYYEIDFDDDAVERILRGEGQKLPGYAHGGLAVKQPSRLKVKR